MHQQAYEFVKESVAGLARNGYVLEIGSWNVNGTVKDLFEGSVYLGIDLVRGNGVDLVIDAKDFDGKGIYDICVTTEAMEHYPHPREIVDCAYRSLKSGGVFIATAASTGRNPHGIDGTQGQQEGEWYGNIATYEMEEMLESVGFTNIRVRYDGGYHDVQATAVKP